MTTWIDKDKNTIPLSHMKHSRCLSIRSRTCFALCKVHALQNTCGIRKWDLSLSYMGIISPAVDCIKYSFSGKDQHELNMEYCVYQICFYGRHLLYFCCNTFLLVIKRITPPPDKLLSISFISIDIRNWNTCNIARATVNISLNIYQ